MKVGGTEVGVGSEINEAEIDHKLGDLKPGNPLLPPDLDTTSRLEVVPVHDDMNHEVKSDWNPGLGVLAMVTEMFLRATYNRSASHKLGIAQQCSGTMVIAVKERWLTY